MPGTLTQLSLKEIHEKYSDPSSAVSPQVLRRLQRDPRTGARKLYKALAKRFDDQKKERNRLDAMLHFERLLWKAGVLHIAGVDEVGMGPLAGPVVAAAVIFPPNTEIEGIDDSKALDEETRNRLDIEIRGKASAIGIGLVMLTKSTASISIMRACLRCGWLFPTCRLFRSMCWSTVERFRTCPSRKTVSTKVMGSIFRSHPRPLSRRCIGTG